MTAFDRREADRLLTRLLDLPAGERLVALNAECDDEALRAAVLRLLQAAEGPDSVIDPESDWTDALWEGLAREAGKRESPMAKDELIGPYRILGEIARGGMAVVYRAERVDGEFTREVAVKVLKAGADTGEAVRRFEQERQILADLDHPNIARMFDAGRTGNGRPYLVMEFVEGVPIDRYCDEQQLSINDRLELFCVVTRAVESAHQNLVVHRDLKPSNILVNRAGEVKLLDFGIARLLETGTDDAAATPTTRPLLRMMTPEYASPEQVRCERVTTASDTYQLGLLLYELLTGHRPYAFSRETPGEFERVICEQPPTRPSTSVSRDALLKRSGGSSGTSVEETCRVRRLSPGRLRRRLRGDLDNIVLMALQKEPRRRYRTADQLAQDIRRYLDGAPVAARADTWAYRGRKFLERHAIGTATAVLLLIAAVALAGFHTVRVQNERDRAQAEAAKAEQISDFLIGLFRGVSPREARGRELTAGELLDHGVMRMEHELSTQPEIKADMLHVLGQTYLELGMYDSADELLNQALELHGEQLGTGHPETASILTDLGLLDYRRGLYKQADTRLAESINQLRASPAEEGAEKLANALLVKGENYSQLGKSDQALSTLQHALELQSEVTGRGSPEAARIMHRIGVLYRTTGQIAFAEQHFNNAIEIYEQKFGSDYPDIGTILVDLASVIHEQGQLERAEEANRRGLAILEQAYGPNHSNVSIALTNLGSLLLQLNRPDEALEILQRSHEVKVAAVGPDHPDVALSLANLGGVYLNSGHLEEARDAFHQGVEVRNNTLEPEQFDAMLLHILVGLGSAEVGLGNEDAANKSLNEALIVWQRAPNTMDPRVRPALRYLGRWLIEQQRCDEASPLFEHVIEIENRMPEPGTEQIAGIEELLAGC